MHYIKLKNSNQRIPVGKIICVGRNYAKHAEELGNEVPKFPLIFLKPSSVMIQSGESIIHPDYSEEMHHEIELVLMIKNKIKNADDTKARDAIGGYAVGLDMTLRDVQLELKSKGHPWTLSKCFDGAAVVSEFVTSDEVNLSEKEIIELKVNNEIKQKTTLGKMIFNSVSIVKFLSSKMTLEEGDLIFTGTPEGVGKVSIGDKLEGRVEKVGTVKTQVVKK